ncbi:MAG: hypothetical protein JOZ45_23200 [Acidobacteriaceae bacterium]|nr:hypothetical protein [Acidobacteriaceae bacterium]
MSRPSGLQANRPAGKRREHWPGAVAQVVFSFECGHRQLAIVMTRANLLVERFFRLAASWVATIKATRLKSP